MYCSISNQKVCRHGDLLKLVDTARSKIPNNEIKTWKMCKQLLTDEGFRGAGILMTIVYIRWLLVFWCSGYQCRVSFVTVFEMPWKQMSFCESRVTTANLEIQKLAGLVFHSNSKCWTRGTLWPMSLKTALMKVKGQTYSLNVKYEITS